MEKQLYLVGYNLLYTLKKDLNWIFINWLNNCYPLEKKTRRKYEY